MLSLIIFFVLCCVYNMHYSNALEQRPIKMIASYRNLVTTEAPDPATVYHKQRFSLFYRARLRNVL